MARLPRIDVPGIPQHLIVRGNNRCTIFRDDADRMIFLGFLEEALRTCACDLHAFVLMTNHVHLLATGHAEGEISALMQAVGCRFARLMNLRWGRTGTLFEGRFRSSLVQSEAYLLTCMRYIELNPVRAGIVRHPSDYQWSSFRANATGDPSTPLVAHEVYCQLGADPFERGLHYRELVAEGVPVRELEQIRASVRQGRALGNEDFSNRLQASLGRPIAPVRLGRPPEAGTG